jgi:HD superfamily phosphohydrolase
MGTFLQPTRYPGISELVNLVDHYLAERHPLFFGGDATHPILPLKRSKVIHDNLWGTNTFSWQELALIDSPILQRLRGIHQTGLAFHIYPSARHTRFEHSLGVTTVASRILDSLLKRQGGKFRDIVKAATPNAVSDPETLQNSIAQLRLELRLAALLHDTGHSLFSHSSEQVFEQLDIVRKASDELAKIVGKRKGAGESIAFAVTISRSVQQLLERAKHNLQDEAANEQYSGPIDMNNVALLIVGRARHPFLQFLGDIISSGFDADKLDYLLRDATSAGLPLSYDFERYFYSVRIEDDVLADGENELKQLYDQVCSVPPQRQADKRIPHEYYETCRLRLPAKAMNTIEQIVICKLMLFSYIYHHPKVRAAEGMLVDLLDFAVSEWRRNGESDSRILERFLDLTDSVVNHPADITAGLSTDDATRHVEESLYRFRNRLLPREVYRIGGAIATGSERALLADFLTSLQDRTQRKDLISQLTTTIAQQLIDDDSSIGKSTEEVVRRVGLRLDVPRPPTFEDVDELVIKGSHGADMQLLQVFPIEQWTHAYTHFRYYVRIFCYSEYISAVRPAAKKAMKLVLKIESDDFYRKIRRQREV